MKNNYNREKIRRILIMKYEKPEMEVLTLESETVIRTSVGTEDVVPNTGASAPGVW